MFFCIRCSLNQGWRATKTIRHSTHAAIVLPIHSTAWDRSYLLTAFAGGDMRAEVMLGYAMRYLHEL